MMKMVLWIEDSSDAIHKVFDELPAEGLDEKLLEKYHIHRVDNLDDALTAVNKRDYDYYLLDIEFPEYDSDGDAAENQNIISSFIESDSDKNGFDPMKAGLYLFMHLLPTTHIDQIRIYSGNITQTTTLKKWTSDSGLDVDWNNVIFNKSDNAGQTAEEVRKWLKDTVESPERILRHAMIELCDQVIKPKKTRTIYSRQFEKISSEKIKAHIEMLQTVAEAAKPLLDSEHVDTYNQLLLMIMTSDCQEQASYITSKDKNEYPNAKKIRLQEDFKRLASVLDRIRNMLVHNTDVQDVYTSTKFVAFVFLVYIRYMAILGDNTNELEKILLKLIVNESGEPEKLSDCYGNLNKAMKDRCSNIDAQKDKRYRYEQLFKKEFVEFPYVGGDCMKLYLFGFLDYYRNKHLKNQEGITVPCVEFIDGKSPEVAIIDTSASRKFTGQWYDDYFKAFYAEAFPK